ncbi:hypothetical protein AZI86_13700 [Bdellovibrio bacteriovorus]|uniref:HTH tetR-type domain-containing protein n=1 Tax=Bdellovibrio bacteriovorus TaxID=959 RepID=A0A150WJC3_BDEBC|nr:TetR/AcrR family transcriptional regulator [Bdellovibrio bacteriovorus]KYG63868.1 hypothetical protein AZI86_13700 [Bdellovibrio bacteriovorus]
MTQTLTPPKTYNEALKRGHYYLQTVGFNGFSFQDLANDLGIRKASLHYYFSSKEDLGLALIKEYEKYFNNFTKKNAKLPAIQQLEAWLKYCYGMTKDHQKLCPIGVLTCELNTFSSKMHKSLAKFQSNQRRWAHQTLKQGIKEKAFRKNLDTSWAADIFLESIQGGLQIARLHKKPALFQKTLKGLLKSFS